MRSLCNNLPYNQTNCITVLSGLGRGYGCGHGRGCLHGRGRVCGCINRYRRTNTCRRMW